MVEELKDLADDFQQLEQLLTCRMMLAAIDRRQQILFGGMSAENSGMQPQYYWYGCHPTFMQFEGLKTPRRTQGKWDGLSGWHVRETENSKSFPACISLLLEGMSHSKRREMH